MVKIGEQINEFEYKLQKKFENLYKPNYHTGLIFLCVGSDKIIGDAIGPIVGTKLENEFMKRGLAKNINIYGKMGNTLNFKNATEVIENIKKCYKRPFIITIDAALSRESHIGRIVISEGIIELGNSLGRSIKLKSNINIKGVVGKYKEEPLENIKTLRKIGFYSVIEMSQNISRGIQKTVTQYNL